MTRVLYWALASSPQWFCWQLNSIFLLLCPHLSSHEKRKMSRTGTDNSLLLNFRIINQTLISEEIFLRDQQAPSLSYLVKKVGAEGVIHREPLLLFLLKMELDPSPSLSTWNRRMSRTGIENSLYRLFWIIYLLANVKVLKMHKVTKCQTCRVPKLLIVELSNLHSAKVASA